MTYLEIVAPDGIGEIAVGTDLAGICAPYVADGDVLVITSKIVSKAEGRTITGDRDAAIGAETVRVVARRGPTSIVENHLGLIMAAAGIDASNVTPGTLVLLPLDPDASARRIRRDLHTATGKNVAVLISDTAGRAWRHGQTDIAIGAAGIDVLDSFEGRTDSYGNELAVTEPAVADEITGIAEVVSGKLGGRPLTVIRGLSDRVLPVGSAGPGATTLVRDLGSDMFGLGSREAVLAALAGRDRAAFGAPASEPDLRIALEECGFALHDAGGDVGDDVGESLVVRASRTDVRLQALLFAYGWRAREDREADSPTHVVPLS